MKWASSLSIGQRLAVAGGGVLGALMRLGLLQLADHRGTGFLVAIAVANVVGSAGVGATVAASIRWDWPATLRTAMTVGVCGGLTTFSTVSLEVARSLRDAAGPATALYAVASLVVYVSAVWAGRCVVGRCAAGAPRPATEL
jgi:fluoride exporter